MFEGRLTGDQITCDIHRFTERDIDLLLAEELRVNFTFSEWFAKQAAPDIDVIAPAIQTRISVVEDGSEADVIACFERQDGGLHRIFVEDKITAGIMPEQLERYVRRAKAELHRGEIKSYSVVLFAPQSYSTYLPDGVVKLTFEDVASELARQSDDPRTGYRAAFLTAARPVSSIAKRDAQVAQTDPYVAEWWDNVYLMLEREFPNYFLEPRTRYPRSVFFAPCTHGMASYLRVDFKGHKGEVDLAFKNVPVGKLEKACEKLPVPGDIIENGQSTSIRIGDLESFRIADGYAIIDTHVFAAYTATKRLLDFWCENRLIFDELAQP